MKNIAFHYFSCFIVSLTVSGSLVGQTTAGTDIVLNAHAKRQVITAFTQDQTLLLDHLKKGETYTFVIPPDPAEGACLPGIELDGRTAELLHFDPVNRLLRFRATVASARLLMHYACSWEQANPPRHYVSIACQSCGSKQALPGLADQSVLEVNFQSVESLVRDVFIGGECFNVTGIAYSGDADQIGRFINGSTNIGLSTGMIMATGNILIAPGPNDLNGAGAGGGGIGGNDSDLGGIATGPLFDLAIVEFDFTPTQTPLTFRYAFASEEYCEYVNTAFNDVFGFFISGPGIAGTKNLATVPMTNIPVTINTINHVANPLLYTHNTPSSLNNCQDGGVLGNVPPVPPATGPGVFELQYDGFTKEMIALAEVIPCSTYHIKLAIGDVGDGLWDAAVFLRANSFDAGGDALATAEYQNGQTSAVEGCSQGSVHFVRGNSDITQPITINFSVSGVSTAVEGVDFAPLVSPVVIPAGQTEVSVPVNVFSDGLAEGPEFFRLVIDNNCLCQQAQVDYMITDNAGFTSNNAGDTTICEGQSVPVLTIPAGGQAPYLYAWSNGDTSQNIMVTPSVTTTYMVTVTDACGSTATDEALVNVRPVYRDTIQLGICPGDSIHLGGNVYTGPDTVSFTLPAIVGCDSVITYTIGALLPAPSVVSVKCPLNITVQALTGAGGAVVNYDQAIAESTCPCPGVEIAHSSGLTSGSLFPFGTSPVCYVAEDACGHTKSCCFEVLVEEESACDSKTLGCMKYELLTITQDQVKRKTYRIRVTNNCTSELIYTAIQLPGGLVADKPLDNSVYLSPGGNEYLVRNPNFTPLYSVRFRSLGVGISHGASDIFRYTLPAQADVAFIRIVSRLSIQDYYEATLNTYYCPVGITPLDERTDEKFFDTPVGPAELLVFPNPSDGYINIDLADWAGETVQIQVFNSLGQRVLQRLATADLMPQRLDLPVGIADGLYILEVSTGAGEKEVVKFVVRH